MRRRELITTAAAGLGLFALGLTGIPARAQVPLDRLSTYFNGIRTLEADFVQFNDDGTRSSGTLYMRRPGRARFEYDPPEKSLVMAGGGQVAIFDGRSNATNPEQYPLKRTPLWLILERNVDLNRRNMVVGHYGDAKTTTLVAQDPDEPQNGRVELVFQNEPLTLAGWSVIDGGGSRTRVQLEKIRLGGELSARLFNIRQEQQSRQR
jgi:outer membrane lipoprotein-sorting protein